MFRPHKFIINNWPFNFYQICGIIGVHIPQHPSQCLFYGIVLTKFTEKAELHAVQFQHRSIILFIIKYQTILNSCIGNHFTNVFFLLLTGTPLFFRQIFYIFSAIGIMSENIQKKDIIPLIIQLKQQQRNCHQCSCHDIIFSWQVGHQYGYFNHCSDKAYGHITRCKAIKKFHGHICLFRYYPHFDTSHNSRFRIHLIFLTAM